LGPLSPIFFHHSNMFSTSKMISMAIRVIIPEAVNNLGFY
jgi:hypothetical protein